MILFYIYVGHLFQLLRNLNALALFFDRKLNFIPHIKYLKVKCLKRLNILRVLSYPSWDADRTTHKIKKNVFHQFVLISLLEQ